MGDMSREPSMEEILSSIRRVMARDEEARSAGLADVFPANDDATDDDIADDVLELTGGERPEDDALTGIAHGAASQSDSASPELVSAVSAAASRQSLETLAAVLAGNAAPQASAAAPVSGDTSVNALVEAALKPVLKQWLDAHLPEIVERLVSREIARITGSKF
jgi:cell pole-organizing protein PopZ